MYADFFGFRELPFNNTPDPRFFYSTPDHEEAMASLIYAVKERKGFVLLTGEVGAGKTLVTRMMLRHFGTHIAFASINHAVQSPEDLMESICTELELPIPAKTSSTQLVRTLHDYLLSQFARNIPVVLVLDEAQNLPVDGFEQLRTIGNLEADDAKLLQIAIVGQPELQQTFLSPQLRQLQQRVFRSFHLPALNREHTEKYVLHRLSVVSDSAGELFSADAFEAIYEVARGLPRIINTICDNALLSAYSADRHTIDGSFVAAVVSQMMPIGLAEELGAQPTTWSPPSGQELPRRTQPSVVEAAGPSRSGVVLAALPTWVEGLGQRVSAIEANLQRATAVAAPPAQPAPVATVGRVASADEAAPPIDSLPEARQHAQRLPQRVDALERRLRGLVCELAEARAIKGGLEPLVQQARMAATRSEGAVRKLDLRHQQLGKLAGTIKTVVADLRRLLDRAHETCTAMVRAEERARTTHSSLARQSRRSAQQVAQMASLSGGFTRSRLVRPCTSSEPAEATIDGTVLEGEANGLDDASGAEGVREMMEDTRATLSDLRELASPEEPAGPTTSLEASSTTRLADEVESLLAMMGAGRDHPKRTSPVGSDGAAVAAHTSTG